ncbi:MAG TPA: ChbG/HpnK family deacetylase, partial [Patescibacteria group bacterium]|nr:ChbG/HpnK family deacetylase [Patescibacteria group bacterium]
MVQHLRENFIITADDYGIRQTAEPILRLVHEKKVDRVAVLIHYVSAEQAEALIATGVKIDLHLELIGLLKSGEKVHESALLRSINFLFRLAFGLITANKVEAEWRDQIVHFQKTFGRLPDGLNSHEHLHCFPPFFKIFLQLATAYDITYIRFGTKGTLIGMHGSLIGKILSFF